MICPECNGKGEVKYYREIDRDENSVTVEGHLDVCHTCHGSGKKTMTNADYIRSMPDEELAEFLYAVDIRGGATYTDGWLDWLKQPYKED